MIDTTLGIDAQALALLNAVSDIEPLEGLSVQSFAFYNGRERWAGLLVRRGWTGPVRTIVFGESRNSDELCVQDWIGQASLNPPTVSEMPEESYRVRRRYPVLAIHSAYQDVLSLIQGMP